MMIGLSRNAALVGAICCFVAGANTKAQTSLQVLTDSADSNPGQAQLPDVARLQSEVQAIVDEALDEHRFAGAAVSVVTADAVLLNEAYGFADADSGLRVDPNRTLFRIASTTKTFTATAIMQLVEQGKVDLQADIREYLDELSFDDSHGTITVEHLLTHQAGFEDRLFGYLGEHPELEGKTLFEQLEILAPKQVRAPGVATGYSNYSFALLGGIVERVSGLPFIDYVHQHILEPLGMQHSTIRLKFLRDGEGDADTERLRRAESRAHVWTGDGFETRRYPTAPVVAAPEGGLVTTAGDMTRFMRMYLNHGSFNGAELLEPETVEQMRKPLLPVAQAVAANAHGFWLMRVGGHQAMVHDGQLNGFRSNMVIVPRLDIGIFVTANSETGSAFVKKLPARVLEALYPAAEPPQPATPIEFAGNEGRYVGAYAPSRRNHSRLEKIANLGRGIAYVDDTGENSLVLYDQTYVKILPDVFVSIEDGRRLGFVDSPGKEGGKAEWMIHDNGGFSERVGMFDTATGFFATLGAVVLASISTIAATLIWSRRTGPDRSLHEVTGRAAWVFSLCALSWIVFAAVFLTAASALSVESIYYAFPTTGLVVSQYLALASAVLSVAAAAMLRSVLSQATVPSIRKTFYSAVVVAFLAGTFIMHQWNVIPVP